jgi:hypothetical protein
MADKCEPALSTPRHSRSPTKTILFVWLIFVASVAATLINPYGWRLWGFLTRTLFVHYRIGEWSPLSPSANVHFYRFAILTAAVAVAGWFSPVRRSFLYWLFLFLAAAAFLQMRHSPFAALAAVAVGPAALEGAAEAIRRRTGFSISAPLRRVIAAAMGGLVLFQGGFAAVELVRARGRIPVNPEHYPVRAVAFMREQRINGNLLTLFEWGEYSIFHLAPACRVSFDGRFETVYPSAVIRDNFAFDLGSEDGFSPRILTVYPTTLALVEKAMLGYSYLRRHPGWRAVFEDDRSALFVADIPANRRWLEREGGVNAGSREAYYFP